MDRQQSKAVDWSSCPLFDLLGIDEIALKKGHKDFVTVISTQIKGKVKILAVLPDRKKTKVKSFINSIPKANRDQIKTVCCDMYEGFINASKESLGTKVQVVADSFHVCKKYRQCVDTLRKKELKRLKKALPEKDYKTLKGAMWALRKKEENLTDQEQQVLENVFERSPSLEEAHRFEKALTAIFNTHYNKQQASKRIKAWIKCVRQSALDCFDSFLDTLKNYWHEILNYSHRKRRKNSGFVEGLNNKIKTIKRRCYGILKIDCLYQRVSLDLEGYEIFC